MPLVKRRAITSVGCSEGNQDDCSTTRRRAAALDMASKHEAAQTLLARVAAESIPAVREAIFTALIDIATAEVAQGLVAMLGIKDAALRNGAIHALQRLCGVAAGSVGALLNHPDPARRIYAVKILEAWGGGWARDRLRAVLEHDVDLNVGLAVVEALCLSGHPEDVPALHIFAARFAEEPAVRFAVDLVLSQAVAARQV